MITKELLKKIAPSAKDSIISDLEKYFDKYLEKYEVNTYLRVAHFLAQAAHESASFKTLEEYASGAAYEGREDLGNVNKGDGIRYKGRGIFQLTGRNNYRTMGAKLGKDLEGNPELAENPEISVLTALEYWKSRGLSALADKDDVKAITKKINGGYNGLADRIEYLNRAKAIIPKDFKLSTGNTCPVPQKESPSEQQTINIIVSKIGDKSPYVKDLQEMLVRKGAKIAADGIYGPKTEQAVKDFQKAKSLTITGSIDTNTLIKLMEF
jgi:putative chitinase